MISFIQLPLRSSEQEAVEKQSIRPLAVAIVLGVILCFQLGLVLCVYFKQ